MRKLALFAGQLELAATTPANARAAGAPTCPASCITEYPVPVPVVYNGPFGIAPNPGGMWFGDQDMIVRTGSYGNFTHYSLPSAGAAAGWVACGRVPAEDRDGSSKVAPMTLDGTVTNEYPTPSPAATLLQIAAGPDRALWFTESFLSTNGNKIGRLTPFANDLS